MELCQIIKSAKKAPIGPPFRTVRFIDLFAGMGGTRIGFEQACAEKNLGASCVFTSEIKTYAIEVYKQNFKEHHIYGDITQINPSHIPDFDYLLAGFPCQPFSSAGQRKGFMDHRGGLFFTIYDILKIKKPEGFLLENVDGLVNHDKGETFKKMLSLLEELGYKTSWKILDSSEFGVPQKRKRVYIAGSKNGFSNLDFFPSHYNNAKNCIEDINFTPTKFSQLLSSKFSMEYLYGKSIKDKRGGENNIHSWELELKGSISEDQKKLLDLILKKRRYKKWAEAKGIDWMDGMPLTTQEISSFFTHKNLQDLLDDLTDKGYLSYEHPKQRILIDGIYKRVPKIDAEKGYNIVSGKLSFPIVKILDPTGFVPTIVATEIGKIAVATPKGVRPISVREGLRFSGFPENYHLPSNYKDSFDLLGNTVMPPVIKAVAMRLLEAK